MEGKVVYIALLDMLLCAVCFLANVVGHLGIPCILCTVYILQKVAC